MSHAAHPPSDASPTPPPQASGTGPALRERQEDAGRLEVADGVVEKIAGHAVTLVPGAAAPPRRLLGVTVGDARPQDTAGVSAEVQDGIASVKATIAVTWPRSVPEVADEVRRRIRDEVASMTGVRVDHVDVAVVAMTAAGSSRPRVQ